MTSSQESWLLYNHLLVWQRSVILSVPPPPELTCTQFSAGTNQTIALYENRGWDIFLKKTANSGLFQVSVSSWIVSVALVMFCIASTLFGFFKIASATYGPMGSLCYNLLYMTFCIYSETLVPITCSVESPAAGAALPAAVRTSDVSGKTQRGWLCAWGTVQAK